MSHLINKARVREYTMSVIASKRPGMSEKMTRVSGEYFDKVDTHVRQFIQNYVESMPSTGKTVK